MKKINKLDVSRLNQTDFLQFIKAIVKEVNSNPATAHLALTLANDVDEINKSFLKGQLTKEAKEIEYLDTLRDRAFIALKNTIYTYLFKDNEPQKRDKASSVYTIIETHGGASIARFEYNKESAYITKLIETIYRREPLAVEVLGIESDIAYLRQCNENFMNYYAKRSTLMVDLVNVIPFSRLRKIVKEHYVDLVNDLESLQRNKSGVEHQVEKIVNRINIEIDKYRLLLGLSEASPTGVVGMSKEG